MLFLPDLYYAAALADAIVMNEVNVLVAGELAALVRIDD